MGPDALSDGAAFYRRNERAVVAFVGPMVRDPEITVDVVAETLARAFESRETFKPELGNERAWLLGIARYVVFAYGGRAGWTARCAPGSGCGR